MLELNNKEFRKHYDLRLTTILMTFSKVNNLTIRFLFSPHGEQAARWLHHKSIHGISVILKVVANVSISRVNIRISHTSKCF